MTEAYLDALTALEHSGLGHLARHSSWLFMLANVLHVLGAALVVGGIAVFDMAVLTHRYPEATKIGAFAIPVAAAGLALQIPTGLLLLATEATKLEINPAFYAKMAFIAIGLLNVAVFHARFGGDLREGSAADGAWLSAFLSLGAWVMTLVAGRMIAYL